MENNNDKLTILSERQKKRYLATATITETYTTYVEARNEDEALEICEQIPLSDLEEDDSVGEWDFEEVEENEGGGRD